MHTHLKSRRKVDGIWHFVSGVNYSHVYRGTVNAQWGSKETELRRGDLNKYISNNTKSEYKRNNFEFCLY
jgi:hypothetical protein